MKIALIIPPAWSIDMPPLGAAYIAATMRRDGHHVDVFDYNVKVLPHIHEDHQELWERFHLDNWLVKEKYDKVLKDRVMELIWPYFEKDIVNKNYDVIAYSNYSTSINTTYHTLLKLKELGETAKIIIGGPAIDINIRHWFKEEHPLLDAAIKGEGEDSVSLLLDRWIHNESFDDIKGVMTKNNMYSPDASNALLADLENLVIPDFSDYTMTDYKDIALPIQMSRGCTAACSFCSETYIYRSRPVDRIIEEFVAGKKLGFDVFNVADSLINSSAKFTQEVCEKLIAQKIDIKWGGNARLDKFLTKDLLQLMKDAGCTFLAFGLESGSDKVLHLMRKGIRAKQAAEVLKNAHEVGINANINILIGFPGEDEEDFQQTLQFIEHTKGYLNFISTGATLGIGPGSHLWTKPEKYGVKTNPDNSIHYDEMFGWTTTDGLNNNFVRHDRLERLKNYLETTGVEYTK